MAADSLDREHCPFDQPWAVEAWLERVAIMIESGGMETASAYREAQGRVVEEWIRDRDTDHK